MRYLIILFSCLLFQSHNAQFTLSGQWVGVLVPPGNGFQTGVPILLEIDAVQKSAVGIFRLEKDQNWFQYEVGGSFTDKKAFTLQSKQSIPLKKNQLSAPPFQLDFHYNDTSDLAFGRFESPGSPYDGHTFHLEKSTIPYAIGNNLLFTQDFVSRCLKDRSLGLSSKAKRDREIATFQFQPIYFAYASYDLQPQYNQYLQKVVNVVNSHSDLRIEIVGNTDGDGSETYNLALSKNRAFAVKRYLEGRGIASSRISLAFEGESKPVDRNDTKEGKQMNRRVEIRFN